MASEISLHKAKTNNIYNVVAVPEMELLKSLGIRAGATLRVICHYPLGGPTLVCVEDCATVAVGKDVASLVSLAPETGDTDSVEDVA
ncbi:MAG: ferrous iron transport protein A [Oscillospiraceae bacterium]|nr:ferrous iron transport protein A [Oscillospiraceae bacterium]MCL2279335.1 ferrous iron transport protein A [Oscillospiraceae bacterium]